jgi:hypothetical protein
MRIISKTITLKMKYYFTTGALVGAILAVMGNASPISQNALSVAASTPSFNPEYSSTAGTFTAVAASFPANTAAPSDTFNTGISQVLRNLDVGPVVFEHGYPEAMLSSSTVGTPTSTNVASFSTTSPRFVGVHHPHLRHGPVVPGRGFHPKSNITANHSSPRTTVSESHHHDPCEYMIPYWVCNIWRHKFHISQDRNGKHHVHNHNQTTHKPLQARSISTATPISHPANATATPSPTLPIYRGHHQLDHRFSQKDMEFHFALQKIDTKIFRTEKRIYDYKREIAQAQYELKYPRHGGTEMSGTDYQLAQEKISHAEKRLETTEMEKIHFEKERLALLGAHQRGLSQS